MRIDPRGGLFTTVVAGSASVDPAAAAGFRDGAARDSQVFAPAGIANVGGGAVVVADAGNRRLRRVTLPDLREPLGEDITALKRIPGEYHVVLVSNELADAGSLWADSVGGVLEHDLRASRSVAGTSIHVDVVRLDAATVPSTLTYVRAAFARGNVDCVVFDLNFRHVRRTFEADRTLEAGDAWVSVVIRDLRAMADALAPSRTAFLTVLAPVAVDAAPSEGFLSSTTTDAQRLTYRDWLRFSTLLEGAVRESSVPSLDLLPATHAYESGPVAPPLMRVASDELTRAGSAFVGDAIARELERERPWAEGSDALHGRARSR